MATVGIDLGNLIERHSMNSEVLILVLALSTFALVVAAALFMRARVAKTKGNAERSAFVEGHGGIPRQNRPGTEH